MSYFAKIEEGVVVKVIIADQAFIDSGEAGQGWINAPEVGIGYAYDSITGTFAPPPPPVLIGSTGNGPLA